MAMHDDLDVVSTTFVTTQPESQEGLTPEIPIGEIPISYINSYDADRDVRCAFCPSHTPHKRGFTALMEDGRIALCGNRCAIKYFGKDIANNLEKILKEQKRRDIDESIIRQMVEASSVVLARISRRILELERQATDACFALHELFAHSHFISAIDSQGNLTLHEEQQRWVQESDQYGRTRRVAISETKQLAHVRGAAAMRTGRSPVNRLARAHDQLSEFVSKAGRARHSDAEREDLIALRRNVLTSLQMGIDFLDNCARFFEPKNISELAYIAGYQRIAVDEVALRRTGGKSELFIATEHSEQALVIPDFRHRPNADLLIAPLQVR